MPSTGDSEPETALGRAVQRSRVVGSARSITDRLGSAAASSRTWAALGVVGVLVAGSRVYRWFVTPSEPQTVSIDLDDSRFLGPVVRTTEAASVSLGRAWPRSRTGRAWRSVVGRVEGSPLRLVASVLLLVVLASLVAATQRPTPIGAGGLAVLAGLSLLGLRDGRSWSELRETRIGHAVGVMIAPPSDEERPPSDEEQR